MPARSASPLSDEALARRSLGEGGWLIAADADQGIGTRVRELWRYRRILWFFSLKSLQTLYSKTVLGPAWIFIK